MGQLSYVKIYAANFVVCAGRDRIRGLAHADGSLITGQVTLNMRQALLKMYVAVAWS